MTTAYMSTEATYIVGTCRTMCPPSEVKRREHQHRLHRFEIIPGTEGLARPRADRSATVKEYSRPAAGRPEARAADIRPAVVLLQTTRYLVRHVAARRDVAWGVVYEYVFDRLRAVRQDMVVQHVTCSACAWVLEHVISFHVYAGYALCEAPTTTFILKINDTHIQECTKRLLVMYETVACKCRQQTYLALYMLFNLGNTHALLYCLSYQLANQTTPLFNKAVKISLAYRSSNFVRVLRLSQSLPAIHVCAVHRHLHACRVALLARMRHGYHSNNMACFPLAHLTQLLALDTHAQTEALCREAGLDVTDAGVHFMKGGAKEGGGAVVKRLAWIDQVLGGEGDVAQLLLGGQCHCQPEL